MKHTKLYERFSEMKKRHPQTVLIMRGSDCYRLYEEDAEVGKALFGLPVFELNFVKYCEFARPLLDTYLPRLIHGGHRVAILGEE